MKSREVFGKIEKFYSREQYMGKGGRLRKYKEISR